MGAMLQFLRNIYPNRFPQNELVVVESIIAMGFCESGVVVENQTDCLID